METLSKLAVSTCILSLWKWLNQSKFVPPQTGSSCNTREVSLFYTVFVMIWEHPELYFILFFKGVWLLSFFSRLDLLCLRSSRLELYFTVAGIYIVTNMFSCCLVSFQQHCPFRTTSAVSISIIYVIFPHRHLHHMVMVFITIIATSTVTPARHVLCSTAYADFQVLLAKKSRAIKHSL